MGAKTCSGRVTATTAAHASARTSVSQTRLPEREAGGAALPALRPRLCEKHRHVLHLAPARTRTHAHTHACMHAHTRTVQRKECGNMPQPPLPWLPHQQWLLQGVGARGDVSASPKTGVLTSTVRDALGASPAARTRSKDKRGPLWSLERCGSPRTLLSLNKCVCAWDGGARLLGEDGGQTSFPKGILKVSKPPESQGKVSLSRIIYMVTEEAL